MKLHYSLEVEIDPHVKVGGYCECLSFCISKLVVIMIRVFCSNRFSYSVQLHTDYVSQCVTFRSVLPKVSNKSALLYDALCSFD